MTSRAAAVMLLAGLAGTTALRAATVYVINGRATALATDYTTAGVNGAQAWTEVTDATSAGNHTNSRTGTFMQYLPDTGVGGSPTGGPFLTYTIHVTDPGSYQLYVSWETNNTDSNTSGSSDSFFASIAELSDGTGGTVADWYEITAKSGSGDGDFSTNMWDGSGGFEQNTAGATNTAMVWDIPTAGDYTLRISPREDGVAIDQFVFQDSSFAAPTGQPLLTSPEPRRLMLLSVGLVAGLLVRRRRPVWGAT